MALYLGKKWTRSELTARIGDPQQLAGARGSVLTDGKADGVRAVDVTTGTGFNFTVLPGRGMDIPRTRAGRSGSSPAPASPRRPTTRNPASSGAAPSTRAS